MLSNITTPNRIRKHQVARRRLETIRRRYERPVEAILNLTPYVPGKPIWEYDSLEEIKLARQ